MVASDRISTYDAVHPTPIPDKGKVLTGLSVFWFERTREIVANHMISTVEGVPEEALGRALVVRRLNMLPVECVVRGYITGSGWKDYQATGSVSGIELPGGLRESERLPEPIFTPSTKADEGHDEAIDLERACELVGDRELMVRVRDVSLELYSFAAEHARDNGVILADTKFEFGLDDDGQLVVGDEVLTPDSSRYWPARRLRGRALASRASTSSTCATGRPPADGTSFRRRLRSRMTWSPGRARATCRPMSSSPASRSPSGLRARALRWRESQGADPPEGRHPGSSG